MLYPLPGRLMQGHLFAVQGLHLPLQTLHSVDHVVEGRDGFGGVLAEQGSIGGRFERRQDFLVLPFDVLLDGLEVLAGEFMGEAEERLILYVRILLAFGC